MTALTRFDPMDQMFPELFRRFGFPTRFADDTPGEIRINVTEKDTDYEVRAESPGARLTPPKREGGGARAIEIQ